MLVSRAPVSAGWASLLTLPVLDLAKPANAKSLFGIVETLRSHLFKNPLTSLLGTFALTLLRRAL